MRQIPVMIRGLLSISCMRVLTALFSFLLFSVLARAWGSITLGEFSTLFAYFMLLVQLPFLGLHWLLSREVAQQPEAVASLASNALLLALPVALLLALLVGLLGQWLYPPHLHLAFWLVGAACLPMAVTVVAEALLTGQQRMQEIALVNILENVVRVGLGLALVLSGQGIASLFAAFLFARVLAALAYWWPAGLHALTTVRACSRGGLRDYLGKCPAFFGILLLSTGMGRIDIILLSLLGSPRDVGLYSPGLKLYEMGLMLPSVITVVLFPVFSRLYETSRQRFDELVPFMIRLLALAGLPAVLLLFYLSPSLLPLLFGAEYAEGAIVLQLLAFSILFVALDQVLAVALMSAGREGLELLILGLAFALCALLLVLLIPRFGYVGAAGATLLSSGFKLLLRYWLVRRTQIVSGIFKALFKPALAGGLMGTCLYSLHTLPPPLAVLPAVLLYLAALLALGGLSREELLHYRTLLSTRESRA